MIPPIGSTQISYTYIRTYIEQLNTISQPHICMAYIPSRLPLAFNRRRPQHSNSNSVETKMLIAAPPGAPVAPSRVSGFPWPTRGATRHALVVSMSNSATRKRGEGSRGVVLIHDVEQRHIPLLESSPSSATSSGLRLDKLHAREHVRGCAWKREFGHFLTRDAMLDEELWAAAWLRAESNWEDRPSERYVDTYKRKFAEQEFAALKGRIRSQHAERCTCIVAVNKERNSVKQTVLKSVVGTLDISIRYFLHGETTPGERIRKPPPGFNIYRADRPRYGYIGNLCVAKFARRQGIAINMMSLAIDITKSYGVDQIFVHVNKDNNPAQRLYEKLGFHMVETNTTNSMEDCNHLLCLRT